MKKVVVLILSLLMVLSMSVPTFALAQPPVESEQSVIARRSDIGYINASIVNLRSGPGTSYPSLGRLAYGTTVEIYWDETVPGWFYVLVLDGTLVGEQGYVSDIYVTIDG